MMAPRGYARLFLPLLLGGLPFQSALAQSRALPTPSDTTAAIGRPLPGPVFENPDFSRAVTRKTRTRTGEPGAANWVQHARYDIDASLDVPSSRVSGNERVIYLNQSPDTLRQLAVYLRQNLFAPGSPRREPVPITGGVTLTRVAAEGEALDTVSRGRRSRSAAAAAPAGYMVNGTIMWILLPHPLLPKDSVKLEFAWSYSPALTPSDGREGRDDHLYFMGYWYPEVAVYDDVNGWVTDPYLNGAEFYMDPAEYDVRITVPHGWVVGATGTLQNPEAVLSKRTLDRLAASRKSREPVHVIAADDQGRGGGFAPGGATATWHYVAHDVRDFAWGTSDRYQWDATIAVVRDSARARSDTVAINSYFRLSAAAAAWPLGGARFTRDAIEQLSAYLWKYPWPQMSSMEGILTGGGMEYPMMTLMQPWADTLSLAGDLMHETGHMWFPMMVGSNETRHPWMDEGLTQFDVAQAMRPLYHEPRSGGRPNDSEQGQRSLYTRTARAGRDQSLMTWGDLFPLELYSMYYNKTAQVLVALRGVLGPDLFQRTLREYGARWRDRHPEPEDFFNTFDQAAGRDLGWFWQTWFYHGWPLDQAIASVKEDGDSLAITVEDRGMAPMPVRLTLTRSGGQVQRVELPVDVWLKGARSAVTRVAKAPAVQRVEIDAEQAFPDVERANQVWTASQR
jgi:peptidase M1-like protein